MSALFRDWLPGVLNGQQLDALYRDGAILGSKPGEFGKSSMDLTLSREAWRLPLGSVKPSKEIFSNQLRHNAVFFEALPPDKQGWFVLKPKQTYVFKLQQTLNQKAMFEWNVYGQSTAKSSIGRMDVLVRLIVDGMDCYESFRPTEMASTGDMYVEATPLTFPVIVKEGTPITQLRLFYGAPEECEFDGREVHRATVATSGNEPDGYLRVDLSNASVGKSEGCAFQAQVSSKHAPVPLWSTPEKKRPKPGEYWGLHKAAVTESGLRYLPIEKESFYILRSKEHLALDGSVAVYCMAIDETIGEMRIHYAGFVHPWFGRDRDDRIGTPLIFEVRGHDVRVVLQDGEKLAKLRYFRMSQPVTKGDPEQYNKQTLKLSNFFGPWK
ncbi:MAG TPA: hypothetical protein DDZ88_08490 [Verrucomicrobiales bacterium]|nr:hypothetical protein [Verrucomicrobiales bacterium]